MAIVESQNLSKIYSTGVFRRSLIPALDGVSISVDQGEIFGLLGPNGAGKTTFVKILLGIVFPTGGTANVLGQPLGPHEVRTQIGYLPESHRYPSFLTAHDTLIFFGRLHGIRNPVLGDRATALLSQVGLSEWARVKVKKFSKGMLQRLGLAQAMLNDPQVLFLDEPTDGVDPVGRKEIRDILTSLRRQGKTIFLNSHMLSEVEEISDRVAILNKGRLLRVGTVHEMTSNQHEYEIRLAVPPSESILSGVRSLCRHLDNEQSLLRVTVNARKDLQQILDFLRKQDCEIESFSPRKSKLEDYFIKVITQGQE